MRIDGEVLQVLGRAETDGNKLVLTGQLDRKMYERVNKILEAVGGKWARSAKAHVFPMDASEAIGNVMLTGEITLPEKFGYFPSPPAVVARLMELANIEKGMACLEPSAGQGAIAMALKAVGAKVDCYELQEANCDVLVSLKPRLDFLVQQDFLALEAQGPGTYDRVVMNPPFEKQADIKHVTHALKFLKPGGRLVSVMSAAVKFRENRMTLDFVSLVAAHGGWIEDLPEESFKVSGTGVSTVVVVIPA